MPDYFPFFEFAGEPFELGRAHGEALGEAVRRQAADTLAAATAQGMTREAALDWSLEQLPKIERLGPHWIDELRGLAAGAKISLAEAVALQVRPGTGKMIGGCTAIAATGEATADGRPLGAQNRDFFLGFRDRTVITRLRPAGRTPLLMHSVPGELGGTGMNGEGLALFANSLWARGGRSWMGIPVLRRALLETADADAAVECARAMVGPAVGSFLLVDAAGRIRNLEIMPERLAVAARDSGVYAHTNHCLDAGQQPLETLPLQSPGSPGRCLTMHASLDAETGRIDVGAMKRMLSQHTPSVEQICRHATKAGEYETAATSVAETASRRLHVSYGPPCEGRWMTYAL
jgi:isopenicillin-N N-acyltransferase like protein